MKRIVCFLALISSIFIMDNVKALEIKKEDIPNGTYIIGTHIFNREQNDVYDGTLKIEHIMLASRTIEIYDLEHMKIYYKNARGKWVNPVNIADLGNSDVPKSFDIEYQNLINNGLTIEFEGVYGETIDFEQKTNIHLSFDLNNSSLEYDNIVFYGSTNLNDGYEVIKSYTKKELEDNYYDIRLPLGTYYYIKAQIDNYEYSNVIDLTKENYSAPKLDVFEVKYVPHGEYEVGNFRFIDIPDSDGVEVYGSVELGQYDITSATDFQSLGKEYKFRSYIDINGTKIYSEFTEPIYLDNEYLVAQPVVATSKEELADGSIRLTIEATTSDNATLSFRGVDYFTNKLVKAETLVIGEKATFIIPVGGSMVFEVIPTRNVNGITVIGLDRDIINIENNPDPLKEKAKHEADLVYTAISTFCTMEYFKSQMEPSYVAKCADGILSSDSVAAMVTTNAIVNATVSQFKLTSLIVELYGFVYELKDDKMVLSSTINNPLSNDEISNIETFINEPLNNAFILMNYNSIDEIFIDRKVSNRTNYDILKYSINSSEFSRPASAIEIESIWNGEAQIETRVATLEQLKSFIKTKTNYDITQNDVENLSTYYNEKLGLFVFTISDEIFERHEIVSGYKSNGYYYVYLEDGTIVVLTKENNNYYFNSCDNTSLGDSIIDK